MTITPVNQGAELVVLYDLGVDLDVIVSMRVVDANNLAFWHGTFFELKDDVLAFFVGLTDLLDELPS